jgi:hypothetical protein
VRIEDMQVEVAFLQVDGSVRVVKVDTFPDPTRIVRAPVLMAGGWGCIDYQFKGRVDSDGRPLYE